MQGVDHYENFPVASWWCPPALRAPIAAIYHFARTADDLADEGDAAPQQRLDDLAEFRTALLNTWCQPEAAARTRWPQVFVPLSVQAHAHALPRQPLLDLLDAFEQDVRYTAAGQRYGRMAELLDYCRRSANPIGRLLLHLYGVNDAAALRQSDAVCTALQLINFWQDLSVDLPRQRHYLPREVLLQHQVDVDTLAPHQDSAAAQAMLATLCHDARERMLSGAPLALRLPGRIGWELRLVVQGGLRVLDKLAQDDHRSWQRRPTVGVADAPRLLWRAWRMPASLQRVQRPVA